MPNAETPGGQGPGSTLDTLKAGEAGVILRVTGDEMLRLRLAEMGVLRGEDVRVLRFAPLGDPMEILLGGYHLSLRKADARNILVART